MGLFRNSAIETEFFQRMKRRTFVLSLMILSTAIVASAHDLFLKLDSYFLKANASGIVRLLNGTFARSDGLVARDRFRDVSRVANGSLSNAESFSWRNEDKTRCWNFSLVRQAHI